MRILVLGGTRFIGLAAVKRLAKLGHDLAVFHRGQTQASLPDGVQELYGDRKQLHHHLPQFRAFSPEVVLDMLAFTEADGRALLEAFSGVARRLLVISSGDVYRAYDRFRGADPGPPDPTPLTEDSPLRDKLYPYRGTASGPEDMKYHYDKILVERAVSREPNKLPATVLRLPMVYGPGDPQHRLWSYLKRMDDGRPYILLPEKLAGARLLRGYVGDMAEAVARCVAYEHTGSKTYHVAEPGDVTEANWVARIARAAGWRGEIVTLPEAQLPEALRLPFDTRQNWTLDSSRIRHELSYAESVLPDEAMHKTVAWERLNPPQKVDSSKFDYVGEDRALAAAGLT